MIKAMKYKLSYLFSNKYILYGTIILIFLLNFNVIIQSGVLLSGGGLFNAEQKYPFLLNNYILIARGYGLLFAIFLGASTIGPDSNSGNLNIVLSAYPSRKKYFLGSIIVCYAYMLFILALMEVNIILLLYIFEIPFQWSDLAVCTIQLPLNSLVILVVTAVGSIFMKGLKSIVVGLVAYCYHYLYIFNSIPILETTSVIDITQYRHILCHLLPITYVYGHSYAIDSVIERARLKTIFPSIELYQILYVVIILVIGCILFEKKDLD